MAREHPLLGVGYANWIPYYSSHYVRAGSSSRELEGRVQLSHNIFIQCMAELGYTGLAAFIVLILGTLWINYRTRRLLRSVRAPPHSFPVQMAYAFDAAMVSYIVNGYFVTVLYYPFFWVNLAFTVALHAIARTTYRPAPAAPHRRFAWRGRVAPALPPAPPR